MLTKSINNNSKNKQEKLNFKYKIENNKLIIDLDFYLYKYDLYGKKITIDLIKNANVKLASPVNGCNKIYSIDFVVDSHSKRIVIDLDGQNFYTYKGIYIDIDLDIRFTIDDAIFFDTIINKGIKKDLKNKTDYIISSKNIIEPHDFFNIFYNYLILGTLHKLLIFFIILFWLLLFIYAPENFIYIIFMGILLYFFIRKLFKNYMTFNLKNYYNFIDLNKNHKVSEIITGKSKIDLINVTIKIVASNIEKGLHITGSGKSRSTRSFSNPVNGIVLYQEKIPFLQKNTDISEYLKGSFSFTKMYTKLYPPSEISSTHGIGVIWKIQLLHNKLIDQEIIGPTDFIKYENFLI